MSQKLSIICPTLVGLAHACPNYIYLVRRAVSHFRLLFCELLRHLLIQKLFTNGRPTTQWEGTSCRTSSMATVRTETTCGPTYSMTRAIGATLWRKGPSVNAIVCVATIAHSGLRTRPFALRKGLGTRVHPSSPQGKMLAWPIRIVDCKLRHGNVFSSGFQCRQQL